MTLRSLRQPYKALEYFKYKQHGVTKTVKNHEYVRAFANQLHGLTHKRVFVAVTITYKPKEKGHYSQAEIMKEFKHFYWHKFLPKHLFKSRKWLKNQKGKQPLVILFSEKHEMKAELDFTPDGGLRYIYPDRFHHHAFMAVHPDHRSFFEKLEGLNKLNGISKNIMTSCVKVCTLDWIYYAGKDFSQNFDGMTVYGTGEMYKEMETPKQAMEALVARVAKIKVQEFDFDDWDFGDRSAAKTHQDRLMDELLAMVGELEGEPAEA